MKLLRGHHWHHLSASLAFILCLGLGIGIGAQSKSVQSPERLVRITLLQLNDVYQIGPVDKGKNAGLARVATLRQKIKATSPNTLFLLAGDTISPSVASTIFKGAHIIETWNAVGLDYACLGNHEFDFGDDVLRARMKESRFTWLGTNVIDRRINKPFNEMPPFVIREFEGIKVGLFGLLTTDTDQSSKPSKNIRFIDPILTTRSVVKQMRAKGAQIIIAVTHLTMSKDKELAATGLVDVIIGGHEHELLQSIAGHTPIFKWGSDARVLGRIDLNIGAQSKRLMSMDWAGIPVTDATPEDQTVAAIVVGYESKVSAEMDKSIGSTSVALDGRSIANRTGETNLSNFIADAFRQVTNADIGFSNGGGMRANKLFPVGQLTKRDVLTMLPFENPVIKIEITGATLKAALENGVSQVVEESESGRFPQVSGVQFEFDGRKPIGSRVVKVTVQGQGLDEKKIYTLATTGFIADGGDGYVMFKNAKRLIDRESAQLDALVVTNAIQTAGEIAPRVEGRITRLDR